MILALALDTLGRLVPVALLGAAVYVVGNGAVSAFLGTIVHPYRQWRRSR